MEVEDDESYDDFVFCKPTPFFFGNIRFAVNQKELPYGKRNVDLGGINVIEMPF